MAPDPRPDLTTCDREPIRTPGSIQPHGVLIGVAGTPAVVAVASANAGAVFGAAAPDLVGRPLADLLPEIAAALAARPPEAGRVAPIGVVERGGVRHTAVAHRSGTLVLVELEEELPAPPALTLDGSDETLTALVGAIQPPATDAEAYDAVARAVRHITGFDRVLIYRFGEDFVGTVVGEDRNEALPSYLGLRFPATDIPAQARELYRLSPIRQIPDADYEPVPLIAAPDVGTVDLGLSVLRSVSPVHVEYMRNMGTGASMSVSVLVDDRLWGLVSCHNRSPRIVPLAVRSACQFVSRILAMRIAAQALNADAADRLGLQAAQARLLARMAEAPDWVRGLTHSTEDLLGVTRSTGAALLGTDTCLMLGDTPSEAEVRRIAAWLDGTGRDLMATSALAAAMGDAGETVGGAAGLLAVSLSRMHADWLIWFRPEAVRTVTWGGDPRKPGDPEAPEVRISPRRSFAAWAETVRGASTPWTAPEIDAARGLRSAVVDIVLRKAEELAALSEDLKRSNRELEAFSYSISHDLRAPFRHIVGYAELLGEREGARLDEKSAHYLANIVDAAETAGKLVDDLLNFAQMGRVRIQPVRIDLNKIAAEVRRSLELDLSGRRVAWQVNDLPPAFGDPSLIRQALFNLVANAVKYTRTRDEAAIEIGGWSGETETTYYVRDNGIGFDMAYADKLFQVFQRLNRTEDFEGNGIGLALVRRIVDRHGGRTWASGQIGHGATFYFALPARKEGSN